MTCLRSILPFSPTAGEERADSRPMCCSKLHGRCEGVAPGWASMIGAAGATFPRGEAMGDALLLAHSAHRGAVAVIDLVAFGS
jgi:hypothetical protein